MERPSLRRSTRNLSRNRGAEAPGQHRGLRSGKVSRWLPAAAFALVVAAAAGCGTGSSSDGAAWSSGTPRATATGTRTPPPQAGPSGTAAPPPASPHPARYVFPVRAPNASFGKTHSEYPASDIFADCGAEVVAVTDGVILETSPRDRYDPDHPVPADRGGMSVSLLGDDGVRYYGSHLSKIVTGIKPGVRVAAGQRIGGVGRTGRANNVCHLHFGISPPCARTGDWWIRRGALWPARFLTAWRSGKGLSPAPTVAAWRRAHGCPAKP